MNDGPRPDRRTRALKESKDEWAKIRDDYLEIADPTEYEFVAKCPHIESWDHWQAILRSPYCRKDINKWREEVTIKLRAQGLRQIVEIAKTEKGFQAAKFLVEKGWDQKRGRPSKEEVEAAKRQDSLVASEVDELFQISGGTDAGRLN